MNYMDGRGDIVSQSKQYYLTFCSSIGPFLDSYGALSIPQTDIESIGLGCLAKPSNPAFGKIVNLEWGDLRPKASLFSKLISRSSFKTNFHFLPFSLKGRLNSWNQSPLIMESFSPLIGSKNDGNQYNKKLENGRIKSTSLRSVGVNKQSSRRLVTMLSNMCKGKKFNKKGRSCTKFNKKKAKSYHAQFSATIKKEKKRSPSSSIKPIPNVFGNCWLSSAVQCVLATPEYLNSRNNDLNGPLVKSLWEVCRVEGRLNENKGYTTEDFLYNLFLRHFKARQGQLKGLCMEKTVQNNFNSVKPIDINILWSHNILIMDGITEASQRALPELDLSGIKSPPEAIAMIPSNESMRWTQNEILNLTKAFRSKIPVLYQLCALAHVTTNKKGFDTGSNEKLHTDAYVSKDGNWYFIGDQEKAALLLPEDVPLKDNSIYFFKRMDDMN